MQYFYIQLRIQVAPAKMSVGVSKLCLKESIANCKVPAHSHGLSEEQSLLVIPVPMWIEPDSLMEVLQMTH